MLAVVTEVNNNIKDIRLICNPMLSPCRARIVDYVSCVGFMANSDAAMHIGQCCGDGFKGCMDEVGGNRRTCIYMQNLTIIVT